MKQYVAKLIPVAALSVAACSSEPATKQAPEAPTTDPSTRSAAVVVGGHGTGKVKSVDPTAGKITLDHGAIPEAGWPAMTMTFDAEPALLKNISPGEQVTFTMIMAGATAKVTAIKPDQK